MKTSRRSLLVALSLCCAPVAFAQQAWPSKPLRIVVPFTAGGPADGLARQLGAHMGTELGQQVLVDNKAGAGGTLGAAEVARSAADGYTMLFSGTGALVIFPALSPKMPYNTDRDLIPVGQAISTPMVIVVGRNSPFKDLGALLKHAKANPGKVNFASAGGGTTTQMGAELLRQEAGVELTHVPYRGAAPALNDVIAGTADMMVADVSAVVAFVKGGQLRPLAVTSLTRSSVLPDVPTTAEAGLRNVVASTWYGLLVPARTPPEVVSRLNAALKKAVQHPDSVAFLKAQGVLPAVGSPEAFGQLMKAESAKWGTLAKAVGAKLD
ncbi:Bug family tripartite tricarboxylate transporter substrate binding protein [Azohydromonas lata]|uniref:Tripartite tricarboxylate transporter substrate binding protein n=1 Tax=Azohydromonas lata TaxID=45677 RepID=A0ABU5IE62_9BURK|nr:tripartite tricarboxylate transporter substrate binding protein [Azohydromonas lata]MDZ5456800.1 tripartite tricarboxylate transporter substrate binding protein [Azohydromonas lata]